MTRAALVILLVSAAACTRATGPEFTITELVYPGATATVASGINDAGHIAGSYWLGDDIYGFVYRDGAFTSVQYPDAGPTQLFGIGPEGDVTGAYRMADEQDPMAFHGFVLTRSGEFRDLRHPEWRYSMGMGVLADGTVVGCYHNEDGIPGMRGMMIPAAAFTASGITPAAVRIYDVAASMHNGATPDGSRVVGTIFDRGRGYVLDGTGSATTIHAPNATRTEAWGVNTSGVVVGTYQDAGAVSHGFVFENGAFTTLDVPDAKSTIVYGINAGGQVVGAFEAPDGPRRGFTAQRR
jgi:uncharacterized membrane protein